MKSTAKRLAAGMLAALLALSLSACEPADGTAPEDSARSGHRTNRGQLCV